jgi:hypothetical protein
VKRQNRFEEIAVRQTQTKGVSGAIGKAGGRDSLRVDAARVKSAGEGLVDHPDVGTVFAANGFPGCVFRGRRQQDERVIVGRFGLRSFSDCRGPPAPWT